MKIGDMVEHEEMLGLVVGLDPFKDNSHTEILWFDKHELGGMIVSVWHNDDFRVV